jgi:hypothetical protein
MTANTELHPLPQHSQHEFKVAENLVATEISKEYDRSEFARMQRTQIDAGKPFLVMKVDWDKSMYSEATGDHLLKLLEFAHKRNIALDVVTGNDKTALIKKLKTANIPTHLWPQVISSAVGTKIEYLKARDEHAPPLREDEEPEYEEDTAFAKMVDNSGYNRRAIVETSQKLIDKTDPSVELDFQNPNVEHAYLDTPEGEAPPPVQPHKVSFYFYAEDDQFDGITQTIAQKFPGTRTAFCSEIDYNDAHPGAARKKYCADILAIDKSGAMQYLALLSRRKAEQYIADNGRTVPYYEFSAKLGDSGNDQFLTALTDDHELSILAGGARPEARTMLEDVTHLDYTERRFRRVYKTASDGSHQWSPAYIESHDKVVATDSLIRGARFAILGAINTSRDALAANPAADHYLRNVYQGLTAIEKGEEPPDEVEQANTQAG